MAAYDYRCGRCGAFEVERPMGSAPPAVRCPRCGDAAARSWSMPALTAPRSARRRAQEAAERSAYEPAVTGGPAALSRTPRRPHNPLHAKLPRP